MLMSFDRGESCNRKDSTESKHMKQNAALQRQLKETNTLYNALVRKYDVLEKQLNECKLTNKKYRRLLKDIHTRYIALAQTLNIKVSSELDLSNYNYRLRSQLHKIFKWEK